jgi:hypothetical protein
MSATELNVAAESAPTVESVRPRRRSTRLITSITLLAATTAAVLGLTAVPAAAAAPCSSVSCVYNYSGASALLACWDGGCPVGSYQWWNNGGRVSMSCWFDDPNHWFNGNYNSDRWFVVQAVPLAGRWVVHSSYVYNQTSVGHC